jgi:hypothetical protein
MLLLLTLHDPSCRTRRKNRGARRLANYTKMFWPYTGVW